MKKQYDAKKGFLLGIDLEGKKVWLQKPSWDCGWYWGFGYVQQWFRGDIDMHTHFDSLFLEKDLHDSFMAYFKETTLTKNEVWTLLELMKTFYNLKEYAEVVGRGGSHITTNPLKDLIINNDEVERINKVILPKLFDEVAKLFAE